MTTPSVGFIGYGEAAYLISQGLKQEGIESIYAFDVNANHPSLGAVIQQRAKENGVELVNSLKELMEKSNYVFCATSAKVALPIAKEVAPYLTEKHVYIDINASSPMVKEAIAEVLENTGAAFVDVAVMDSVPLWKHQVPMFISGTGAKVFEEFASSYNMKVTFISEKAGSSSAIKMFRSIFMKGFSALLIETIQSSSIYGVSDIVLESLNNSVTKRPLEETANLLLNRTSIHVERRVSEMSEVISTLEMLNVDATMSKAIKEKLQMLVDLKVREILNNQAPEHYSTLIDILNNATEKHS
ncbi:DUF1932 domain-containing protein [Ureibacillus thermophilus]|uniref:NAD(P)-dependent oxidoreductase n=1 Tax=Ureibacillus thermophilus TaxID=367743 RepID=A0A4P6UUU5_9BACL|nr:DUF1932 domain-containing protein [Ureibacillus thermophilus]QBK25971.1 NAD(P)-dependent oxidoreductase [Ureibacillus thermophilus]